MAQKLIKNNLLSNKHTSNGWAGGERFSDPIVHQDCVNNSFFSFI
jgi:hypothetical protein